MRPSNSDRGPSPSTRVAPIEPEAHAAGRGLDTPIFAGEAPFLVARLIDGAGTPLAGRSVRVAVSGETDGGELRSFLAQIVASDEGRLAWALAEERRVDPNYVAFQIGLSTEGRRSADAAPLSNLVPVAPEIAAARPVDLGDVVLREAPTLLAGRVVDVAGAPIADATVRLMSVEREGRSTVRRSVPGLETRSGEDGLFALCGDVPPSYEEFSVQAACQSYEPSGQVAVLLGRENLTLVLTMAGALTGRFLVDPEFDPQGWTLTIGCEDFVENSSTEIQTHLPTSGDFRFEQLLPTIYDLSLRTNAALVFLRDSIVVGPSTWSRTVAAEAPWSPAPTAAPISSSTCARSTSRSVRRAGARSACSASTPT